MRTAFGLVGAGVSAAGLAEAFDVVLGLVSFALAAGVSVGPVGFFEAGFMGWCFVGVDSD